MPKPLPQPTGISRRYWDASNRGELAFQRCGACGRAQFPPRERCAACRGEELLWEVSAGLGAVHAATRVDRAPTPAFAAETPYVLALVDLAEGFRILCNLRGAAEAAEPGLPVRIVFERLSDDVVLPQAELA